MNIKSIPFHKLPFTQLFKDYTNDYQKLAPFFETNPFNKAKIEKRFTEFSFKGDRAKTVDYLKKFNSAFTDDEATFASIEKLADDSSIAVVTGQQLTMFGGSLFTVFKIITAIQTAKTWQKAFNRPCVPVFWLADEDHDFKEIATIGIPQSDVIQNYTLNHTNKNYPRISELELGDNFAGFRKAVEESQFDTDFSYELWKLIDSAYKKNATIGTSFGKLILKMFSKQGLILAGSNSKEAKELIKEPLKKSVGNSIVLHESLKKTTIELIEAGYHSQVQVQPSNLFFIDENCSRLKINFVDNKWIVDGTNQSWSSDELEKKIDETPERFSPNVFLRPVIQNYLIPGVSYVGGPGEIAYHAQMKDFYKEFDLLTPIIIPRFSATIIESGINRILQKLPFSFEEYEKRIEDLESEYIQHSGAPDIEPLFDEWKNEVERISALKAVRVEEIDATLKKSSEKAKTIFFTELDKLKGKVYRSLKEQENVQLQRIKKIKVQLFPNSNLQEREVAFIYFMNKYGLSFWDDLLDEISVESLDKHYLIHL